MYNVWSYDFFDMTLRHGIISASLRRHMINPNNGTSQNNENSFIFASCHTLSYKNPYLTQKEAVIIINYQTIGSFIGQHCHSIE